MVTWSDYTALGREAYASWGPGGIPEEEAVIAWLEERGGYCDVDTFINTVKTIEAYA